jgi:TusE/DsrC/DsvC family sulfur relay protein
MSTFEYESETYEVDRKNFLMHFNEWNEKFASGMAPHLGIPKGLTKEHWDVIHFIHRTFRETGACPLVYETCQASGLRLSDLRRLFPTGYFRGACRIAGIPSDAGHLGPAYDPSGLTDTMSFMQSYDKKYEVDVRGFLVNPEDWDEYYAVYRAYDMRINNGKLNDKHWKIIRYLRKSYQEKKDVPTVYETCEANDIDLNELEQLFPHGYHRGAVKIAGLRA